MAEMSPLAHSISPAGHVLGRKLDSIPFSPYHLMLITVLALVPRRLPTTTAARPSC